jgi:hypothetical protein
VLTKVRRDVSAGSRHQYIGDDGDLESVSATAGATKLDILSGAGECRSQSKSAARSRSTSAAVISALRR